MIRITKNTNKRYKIPKKINIGPHTITVKFVRSKVLDGDMGLAKFDTFEIFINKEASTAMRYSTFIHEIVEFINFIYELKLPHNKITVLETALQSISLIDNESLKK